MINEGYIKFNCTWNKTPALNSPHITELLTWRNKLYTYGLIGIYDNGIGFGNVSIRINTSNSFWITGSQTGNLRMCDKSHIAKVVDHSIDNNTIVCEGPIKASSESLSHAALYSSNNNIRAIIHTHHKKLWDILKGKLPTTDESVEYGTPQMAHELMRIYNTILDNKVPVIIMGGHEEGIISFGADLKEAGEALLDCLKKYSS